MKEKYFVFSAEPLVSEGICRKTSVQEKKQEKGLSLRQILLLLLWQCSCFVNRSKYGFRHVLHGQDSGEALRILP